MTLSEKSDYDACGEARRSDGVTWSASDF